MDGTNYDGRSFGTLRDTAMEDRAAIRTAVLMTAGGLAVLVLTAVLAAGFGGGAELFGDPALVGLLGP